MNQKTKLAALFIAVILCLSIFTACSSKDAPEEPSVQNPDTTSNDEAVDETQSPAGGDADISEFTVTPPEGWKTLQDDIRAKLFYTDNDTDGNARFGGGDSYDEELFSDREKLKDYFKLMRGESTDDYNIEEVTLPYAERAVRLVQKEDAHGFLSVVYYIDLSGSCDFFFEMSAVSEKFDSYLSDWENALNTTIIELVHN